MGTKEVIVRLIPVCAAVAALACNQSAISPSVPDNPLDVTRVDVFCVGVPAGQGISMLVGETRDLCSAKATHRNGQIDVLDATTATWSVADPTVASAGPITQPTGVKVVEVAALAPGQTVVSATFAGHTGVLSLAVTAEDYFRFGAGAYQGDPRPGNTITMVAVGSYSVASAEEGQLTYRISDQSDVVATTATAAFKNYNSFAMSVVFKIPAMSTQLCPTVSLQIGSKTLSASPTEICVPVHQ